MKKIYILFTLLIVSYISNAQLSMLHVGVKGGINNSIYLQQVNNGSFAIIGSYAGYHVGPMLYIEPRKFIGINTGALFNTSGWVDDFGTLADTLLYRKDVFQNIQIPLTLAIKIGISDIFRVSVESGFYANYTLNGYTNFKDTYGILHEKAVEWAKWNDTPVINDFSYRRINTGFIVGCGVHVKAFSAGVNYNLGLGNLTNQSSNVIQNHIWQVYIGIRTL